MAVTEGVRFGNGWVSNVDFIDVSRAYFHAKARRSIFVKLPQEDHTPGYVGKLVKAMYGTRDAAHN